MDDVDITLHQHAFHVYHAYVNGVHNQPGSVQVAVNIIDDASLAPLFIPIAVGAKLFHVNVPKAQVLPLHWLSKAL